MSLQPIPSFSERHLKDGCPASSFVLCQSENIQVNGELTMNVDNVAETT